MSMHLDPKTQSSYAICVKKLAGLFLVIYNAISWDTQSFPNAFAPSSIETKTSFDWYTS